MKVDPADRVAFHDLAPEDADFLKEVLQGLSQSRKAIPAKFFYDARGSELFEAITWKRLGLYFGPIVLVNVNGFYDPCIELLDRTVDEGFMNPQHRQMWQLVDAPAVVPLVILVGQSGRPVVARADKIDIVVPG